MYHVISVGVMLLNNPHTNNKAICINLSRLKQLEMKTHPEANEYMNN